MAVAIWVGVWLPARLTTKAWLSMDRLYSMALWGVPGGIIGARLVHVIDYWSYYSANPGTILAPAADSANTGTVSVPHL